MNLPTSLNTSDYTYQACGCGEFNPNNNSGNGGGNNRPARTPRPTPSPTPAPVQQQTSSGGGSGSCQDDSNWSITTKRGTSTCSWVAGKPEKRCNKTGNNGRKASDACRASCGTCSSSSSGGGNPPPSNGNNNSGETGSCSDDSSWKLTTKKGPKTCSWVAGNPGKRCKKTGDNGEKASEACPDACGTSCSGSGRGGGGTTSNSSSSSQCRDDPNWTLLTNRGTFTCDWVSSKPDKRCSKSGAEQACKASCGGC